MNLLAPKRSVGRTDATPSIPIRVISTLPVETQHRLRARWVILVGVLIVVSFGIGFSVSSYVRPAPLPPEPKIQVADFQLEVPDGETVVTITSREHGEELGRLVISRRGDSILGLPQSERTIAPPDA